MRHDISAFYGVRAELASPASAQLLQVWVVDATSRNLVVRVESPFEKKVGAVFDVRLFGLQSTARFIAKYVGFERSAIYQLLKSGALRSGSGFDADYFDVEHRFEILSAPTFHPPEGDFRIAVSSLKVWRELLSTGIEMEVINLGRSQLCCYSDMEMEIQTHHVLKIDTHLGLVEIGGEVVECAPISTVSDHFRVTFAVRPSGRIEAAKWSQFVESQGSPI